MTRKQGSSIPPEIENRVNEEIEAHKVELANLLVSRSVEHHALVGKFFHCHLLLENLLLQIIKRENPKIGSIEKIAKHFSQKLSILESMSDRPFASFFPALRAINEIRNKLGHNLNYVEIDEAKLDIIKQTLNDSTIEYDSAIEVIQLFTIKFHLNVMAVFSFEIAADDWIKDQESTQPSLAEALKLYAKNHLVTKT